MQFYTRASVVIRDFDGIVSVYLCLPYSISLREMCLKNNEYGHQQPK